MPIAPPRPKGPPLGALRAFEAAARLGSFAAAADELSVTPGAVSQQIKQVETWAETRLFTRSAGGAALTRAGEALYPKLREAFDALGEAADILRSFSPHPTLNIATLPSIAQLWLGPRLPALRAALPGRAISVSALERAPDLARGLFDCSLFLGSPSSDSTALAPDSLAPVCSPEIGARLKAPQDLLGETLIIDESWKDDWPAWLDQMGLAIAPQTRTTRHSLYALALSDALAGQGVLMGHTPLVEAEIEAGRLIRPFTFELKTGQSLILEHAGSAAQDKIKAVVEEALSA